MNDASFDALTRRAALPAIGTVGLGGAADFTGSLTANAKHKKTNTSRKAKQKCERQAEQCLEVLTFLCGTPECVATAEQCCPFLGTCDFTGYFNCVTLVIE